MEARVTWDRDLQFVGVADSGYAVRMDSASTAETGAGPVELTAIALAGCTAMDVISILKKKHQQVASFEVRVHARRAAEYPKVISHAELIYHVVGHEIDEAAVLRAIELSVSRYCPVHAMLKKAFPIDLKYSIYEGGRSGEPRLVSHGAVEHPVSASGD